MDQSTDCGSMVKFCSAQCCQRVMQATIQKMKQEVLACPQCTVDNIACLNAMTEAFSAIGRPPVHPGETASHGCVATAQVGTEETKAKANVKIEKTAIKSRLRTVVKSPSEVTLHPNKMMKKTIKAEAPSTGQSCSMGKLTGNPFFNFVREVRREMCGKKQTDVVIEASRRWNHMTHCEKCKYVKKNVKNEASDKESK